MPASTDPEVPVSRFIVSVPAHDDQLVEAVDASEARRQARRALGLERLPAGTAVEELPGEDPVEAAEEAAENAAMAARIAAEDAARAARLAKP
jgi:hypothetical protein